MGITVLVVSVLLGTAYLFLREYVSVTDDGILLSFPFWNGTYFTNPSTPPSPPPDDGPINIVIESTPTPKSTPEPEPEPTPEPVTETPLRAVFVPQTALKSKNKLASISSLCDNGSVDTVVFEVKSTDGVISTKKKELTEALQLLEGKAVLVAYMSVLLDNTITQQERTFGIKHTSGVNWLDVNKSRWINPFIPKAREWLASQVSACSALPFDAILFDTMWFPTEGRLNVIGWGQYAEQPRPEILNTLATELIATTELPCWAVIQSDVVTGTQPQAGDAAQDTEFFENTFDKLFARLPLGESNQTFGSSVLPIIQMPEYTPGDYNSFLAVSAAAEYPPEVFSR